MCGNNREATPEQKQKKGQCERALPLWLEAVPPLSPSASPTLWVAFFLLQLFRILFSFFELLLQLFIFATVGRLLAVYRAFPSSVADCKTSRSKPLAPDPLRGSLWLLSGCSVGGLLAHLWPFVVVGHAKLSSPYVKIPRSAAQPPSVSHPAVMHSFIRYCWISFIFCSSCCWDTFMSCQITTRSLTCSSSIPFQSHQLIASLQGKGNVIPFLTSVCTHTPLRQVVRSFIGRLYQVHFPWLKESSGDLHCLCNGHFI